MRFLSLLNINEKVTALRNNLIGATQNHQNFCFRKSVICHIMTTPFQTFFRISLESISLLAPFIVVMEQAYS